MKPNKDRIINDIRTLQEQEKNCFYKPIRVGNFQDNNYFAHESSGDNNKNLLVK